MWLFRPVIPYPIARYSAVLLSTALIFGTVQAIQSVHAASDRQTATEQTATRQLDSLTAAYAAFHTYQGQIAQYKKEGLNTANAEKQLAEAKVLLAQGQYLDAKIVIKTGVTQLTALKTAADAEERQKGTLEMVIKGSSSEPLLAGVVVTLTQNSTEVGKGISGSDGKVSFHLPAGTYQATFEHGSYKTIESYAAEIVAEKTVTKEVALEFIPPPPTPAPTPRPVSTPTPTPVSNSTAHSSYYTKTLDTSRGRFSANIMEFQLGAGKIKAVADTAADGDCTNDCPVMSVKSYADRWGGVAAVNGTYFCPTAYPDCAGKTNSFYWKIFNPRLNMMVNQDNTLGEQDPFITFDSVGNPTYYHTWRSFYDAHATTYTGISCKPALVENGNYVVNESDLDDKQRTAYITRGSFGLKGSTLYVVNISGATVMDAGAYMQALGVDNAVNMDAGGSTGMYYNGAYKLGPGRSVPNALVLIEQ